jgi:predicted component of viral defense system (DUF524 family)
MERFEKQVDFRNDNGQVVGHMRLLAETASGLELIKFISGEEARVHGEEQLQLLEGQVYQYEIIESGLTLAGQSGVTSRFLVGSDKLDRGTISPGFRAGLLPLQLTRKNITVGTANLEVRSLKIGYRDDYRSMLEDIANESINLLFQLRAPTQTKLVIDSKSDAKTILQQFFFVKSLLSSNEFKDAISQILSSPHSQLLTEEEEQKLGKIGKVNGSQIRQMAYKQPRRSLPNGHALTKILCKGPERPSVPTHLMVQIHRETVDTPENRFIKYAISEFFEFVSTVEKRLLSLDKHSQIFATREVKPLREKFDQYLHASLFRNISPLKTLPLGSPVLQRKSGYREVLQSWIKFYAASRLIWHGGDDVYGAGKRDLAVLYEYWLFFGLWSVIRKLVDIHPTTEARSFIEPTADGFGLKLRSGILLSIEGACFQHKGSRLRLQFSYNRTFSEAKTSTFHRGLDYKKSYPNSGSWTRRMRPDFTISFWPDGISAEEAEVSERIVHVHFDAKYSVSRIVELFGGENEDLSLGKKNEKHGNYRRADLLKMHAYKDSIRRSQGAYILYPGLNRDDDSGGEETEYCAWLGFQEILPGLGAFVVRPGGDKVASLNILEKFLLDVLDYVAVRKDRM